GRVTLVGVVGTEDQRQRAAELAQAEGARHVVNRLDVDAAQAGRALRLGDPSVTDDELLAAVRAALANDPRVPDGVAATVREGVVRLSGSVDGEDARRAATAAARSALGCRKVEDALAVREAMAGAPGSAL